MGQRDYLESIQWTCRTIFLIFLSRLLERCLFSEKWTKIIQVRFASNCQTATGKKDLRELS